MPDDLLATLFEVLAAKRMMLVTAESCTGGLLAATITHKPGASKIFERGFITYTNRAKSEQLEVPEQLLESRGAVSAEVAESMALGALKHSHAQLSVSITGIAGPDGGSAEKPVGLVYFGYALKGGSSGAVRNNFDGSREEIRTKAASTAIKHLISVLQEEE